MAVASVPALLELSVRRTLRVSAWGGSSRLWSLAKLTIAWESAIEYVTEERVRVAKAGEPGGATPWVPKTVCALAEHSLTVTLQTKDEGLQAYPEEVSNTPLRFPPSMKSRLLPKAADAR